MLCTNWEFPFSISHYIFHLNYYFKLWTYILHRCHLFTFSLKAFAVIIIISNDIKLGTHHFLIADYSSKDSLMVRQQCILLSRLKLQLSMWHVVYTLPLSHAAFNLPWKIIVRVGDYMFIRERLTVKFTI